MRRVVSQRYWRHLVGFTLWMAWLAPAAAGQVKKAEPFAFSRSGISGHPSERGVGGARPRSAGGSPRVEAFLTTRTKPPCPPDTWPEQVSTFLTTDPQAVVWFVAGVLKGDVLSSEFFDPSGAPYTPAGGPWEPAPADGYFCFPDEPLRIAGAAPASMPGTWTVKVTLNRETLFTFTFNIARPDDSGPRLERYLTTRAAPPECEGNAEPSATISASNADAALRFYVAGTKAGDVASSEYFDPSGKLYAPFSGPWAPVRGDGLTCFTDSLKIAGRPAASLPGRWTVRVHYNQRLLFATTFFIELADPEPCTYSISPETNSVQTGGGTASVDVAAGPGCAWEAVSNAPWITITAGRTGSGAGTVRFTAGANAGTEARTGTLTIAGRTHTVRQAGTPRPCSYSLDPPGAFVGAAGGAGTVAVATDAGCPWTAVTNASWLNITQGASGTGSGNVTYSIAANPAAAPREAALTIAGRAFQVTQAGTAPNLGIMTTLVGTDWVFTGDGKPALEAPVGRAASAGADAAGNFYIVDPDNHMVFRVSPDGVLRTVAGNGIQGFSGDGGRAANASLNRPTDVQIDRDGNLYITDSGNHRVRRVNREGIITTFAGTGRRGNSGDGGSAPKAELSFPYRLALHHTGAGLNTYILSGTRIRRISPDGNIATIAGSDESRSGGDGGPAANASFASLNGIAADAQGNLYVAEWQQSVVRKIGTDGNIHRFAGNGNPGWAGDGGSALNASLRNPEGLAVDSAGNLYIADTNNSRVRRVAVNGLISTFAGNGRTEFSGDGGPAVQAGLYFPLAVGTGGNSVYIADHTNMRVRRVGPDGVIQTVAGNAGFRRFADGSPAANAYLFRPQGIGQDRRGNLYIADWQSSTVWKLDAERRISRFAGIGVAGSSSEGRPAVDSLLSLPADIAVDAKGDVYIADSGNGAVRKVGADGTMTTFARDLGEPVALAVDLQDNLYVADLQAHRIVKFGPDGRREVVAGNGRRDYCGDGQAATAACLNSPQGVAWHAGNLYIADTGNHVIRVVTNGVITTLAGSGRAGFNGDGGPPRSAALYYPGGLAVDAEGNLYIADNWNERVRRVSADAAIIGTVAGDGRRLFAGDGGPAVSASLNTPVDVLVDGGSLLIADYFNDRIRAVITTVPSFQISPAALSFDAGRSSQATAPQTLTLTGSLAGLSYSSTVRGTGDTKWLRLSPAEGVLPATIHVTADPAGLRPGQHRATIVFAVPPGLTRAVEVTFTLEDPFPPKLGFEPGAVTLSVPERTQGEETLWVLNRGGGQLSFSAAVSREGAGWLRVTTVSGRATAGEAGSVSLVADATSLSPGTYRAVVELSSADTGERQTVPVTLTVTPARRPKLLISPRELYFRGVAPAGRDIDQFVYVLNIGAGVMNWSARVSEGGNWLSITGATGATDSAASRVPMIQAATNPANLRAGRHSGQIVITAPEAEGGEQRVNVTLEVFDDGRPLGPYIRPNALVFVAAGGTAPGSQIVDVVNMSSQDMTFDAWVGPRSVEPLFAFPARTALPRYRAAQLQVQPRLGQPGGGLYEGTLTLKFPGNANRNVNLLLFVPGAAGAGAAAASCGTRLHVLFTRAEADFRAVAGRPFPLDVQVVDGCGAPVGAGSVIASFGEEQAAVSLVALKDGHWVGTWTPRPSASAREVSIVVRARQAGTAAIGTAAISGRVEPQ